MKSRHFPPIEVDLYVVNKPLTDEERKEIVEFLENYKRKKEIKAKHALAHRKSIYSKKKAKKYEVVESAIASAHEPEPALYLERPLTEKDNKKRKLAAKIKPARKKSKAKA